jgi:hypothetical protein
VVLLLEAKRRWFKKLLLVQAFAYACYVCLTMAVGDALMLVGGMVSSLLPGWPGFFVFCGQSSLVSLGLLPLQSHVSASLIKLLQVLF